MPTAGSVETIYNRNYIAVDPSAPAGPITYRVSNPDSITGSGGGSGASYDFDGIAPINVSTVLGAGSNPDNVQTSLDISQLADRSL